MTSMQRFPYADLQDLEQMLSIIRARPSDRADDFPGIMDLEEWTTEIAPSREIALWKIGSEAISGYSIVDTNFRTLWFETVWDADNSALERAMIRWGERSLRNSVQSAANGGGNGHNLSLRVSCRDDFFDRIILLEAEGFEVGTGYTVHLARDLSQPILELHPPAGFAIRSLRNDEIDDVVALHRAGFGTENLTVEGRRSWMTASDYDPALDLVAVAPDGSLASYCFCHISHADNELTGEKVGWTDPIATHPAHQRKGLASALLCKGMALLRKRGMEKATLGTWSENEPMWNAAEKVGYAVRAKTLFYAKELE